MALNIKDSGLKIRVSDKVKEFKFGLMAPCMKDGGSIIKQMEKEDLFMLMETFTMEIGKMIKLMELVFTLT